MNTKLKNERRLRRHKRVRAKVQGTEAKPRLCVFRANRHIYAQLINDETGKILVATNDLGFKKSEAKNTKSEIAAKVGNLIADKAKDLKIEKVVFDKEGYKYHGRVKALADGARKGGLKF